MFISYALPYVTIDMAFVIVGELSAEGLKSELKIEPILIEQRIILLLGHQSHVKSQAHQTIATSTAWASILPRRISRLKIWIA